MAQIALSREHHQQALEYLAESYGIVMRLGDASVIANVGVYLGQLLLAAGEKEHGIAVLENSFEAFQKLGQADIAQQVATVIDQA